MVALVKEGWTLELKAGDVVEPSKEIRESGWGVGLLLILGPGARRGELATLDLESGEVSPETFSTAGAGCDAGWFWTKLAEG